MADEGNAQETPPETPAGTATADDGPDELTAAQQRAAEAETALWRERAVSAAGLPPELADRLKGETEEDLKADATELAKFVGSAANQPSLRQQSKPTVGAGATQGTDTPEKVDPTKLAEAIRARMGY